jgi:hypothetical protein
MPKRTHEIAEALGRLVAAAIFAREADSIKRAEHAKLVECHDAEDERQQLDALNVIETQSDHSIDERGLIESQLQ